MEPTLDLEGVTIWRWHAPTSTRRPIVDAVSWRVAPGETWALLGPNGAGKTTLLTVAAAVEFPSSGRVTILGETLGRTDTARLRERIGFVDARLASRFGSELTVTQIVETGASGTIGWFPERVDDAARLRVQELLATFALGAIAERPLRNCSHGERTRTLIARALVARPPLLLLDEPGSGLDLPGRETLLEALATLARDEPHLATVLTTHHLEELPSSTTHGLLIRNGAVIAMGAVDRVITDEPLSKCFGLDTRVTRNPAGRWHATGRFSI
jgi:iron complex transport system ATP-binding protein